MASETQNFHCSWVCQGLLNDFSTTSAINPMESNWSVKSRFIQGISCEFEACSRRFLKVWGWSWLGLFAGAWWGIGMLTGVGGGGRPGRCLLNSVVTLESRNKCLLYPAFCADFFFFFANASFKQESFGLFVGLSTGFWLEVEQGSFCPDTSNLTIRTLKDTTIWILTIPKSPYIEILVSRMVSRC